MSKKKNPNTNKTVVHCFWCDKAAPRSDMTQDHLFCKYLRKQYVGTKGNGRVEISCAPCNSLRGRISYASMLIRRLDANEWSDFKGSQGKPLPHEVILMIALKVVSCIDLKHFREVICMKIKDNLHRSILVDEIDRVSKFCPFTYHKPLENWNWKEEFPFDLTGFDVQ